PPGVKPEPPFVGPPDPAPARDDPKVVVQPPAPPRPAGRFAIPDQDAQKRAETLIRDVFAPEYAKTTPMDQRNLAEKFLQQAKETRDDAVARYVLLREARDLAAQASELTAAFEAVETLGKAFDIDVLAGKAWVLARIGQVSKSSMIHVQLAEAALPLIAAEV